MPRRSPIATAGPIGDNSEATKEPGEPNHAGIPAGPRSAQLTAPYAGRATFDTCYSEFDTLLAVYTGDQVSNLQPVAADDNACGAQSQLSFMAAAGVTYIGSRSTQRSARRVLRARLEPPPSNDDFVAAIELVGDSGSVDGNTYYGTLEPESPSTVRTDPHRSGTDGPPVDGAGGVRVVRQRLRDIARCLHGRQRRCSDACRAGRQRLPGRVRIAGVVRCIRWTGVPHRGRRGIRRARRPRAALEPLGPRAGEPRPADDPGPADRRRHAQRHDRPVGRNSAAHLRLPMGPLHIQQLPADLRRERRPISDELRTSRIG